MNGKNKKMFIIQVPIFTSKEKPCDTGMFEPLNYEELLNGIEYKVKQYNLSGKKLKQKKKNKIKEIEVESIESKRVSIGEHEAILLRINACETNSIDGYVEIDRKITLNENSKIGSENYIALLYPDIIGIDPEELVYRWLIFLYEDPNKENKEISSIIKLVAKRILDIEIKNVKLNDVLAKIKKMGNIPELRIRLFSVITEDNEVDIMHKEYLSKFKLKKEKDISYRNIPYDDTADLIKNIDYEDFDSSEIKVSDGNNEIRIKGHLNNAKEKVDQIAEEIFNERIYIEEEEMAHIYEEDFIVNKIKIVINRFMKINE
ncbi:MAG: hypothetical protein PQJ61_00495 [Spirochaetales bacterium]|uniref:Uncharacterized protein n=1 Tax=Candidatus Thalassospirochaeta sargassi TaxID=3119039 RepID=A0AAJ1ICJ5_9SPIO|nr:hypothetical protein [Spirochaetales bacterium]